MRHPRTGGDSQHRADTRLDQEQRLLAEAVFGKAGDDGSDRTGEHQHEGEQGYAEGKSRPARAPEVSISAPRTRNRVHGIGDQDR